MDYAVVCLVALLAAALTFFSGFGLGTLLMPALAFFMPLPVAVAATAVVHLANNLFKAALVGRHANLSVLIRFAIPAIIAALAGAWLLEIIAARTLPLTSWHAGTRTFDITLLKLIIAAIMLAFAAMELWPTFSKWSIHERWLPLGGVISGFFGGLSGHQGALRAAFLARANLSKEAFIGTGVISAVEGNSADSVKGRTIDLTDATEVGKIVFVARLGAHLFDDPGNAKATPTPTPADPAKAPTPAPKAVTEAQVTAARDRARRVLLLALDDPDAWASSVGWYAALGAGPEALEQHLDALTAVTVEDVRAAARRLTTDQRTVVVLRPSPAGEE
jgi:uncharacterized membrane protein YfcA